MTTFTINSDNVLQAFATKNPPAPLAGVTYIHLFRSESEMQESLAHVGIADLVEIWNGLAGTQGFEALKPVKKFENRKKALARLWTAMQSLTPQTSPEKAKTVKSPRKSAVSSEPRTAATAPKPTAEEAVVRKSKKEEVLAMLRRPGGATNAEIQTATGWQPHTVRGFLSTAPKKLGKRISTSTNEEGARVYHMVYNAEK